MYVTPIAGIPNLTASHAKGHENRRPHVVEPQIKALVVAFLCRVRGADIRHAHPLSHAAEYSPRGALFQGGGYTHHPMKTGVTVLALYDRISLYHTLAPWITGLHRTVWPADLAVPHITYTTDPTWCVERDTNEYLIMVRQFLKPPATDLRLMERLRARYRRIYFLNGNAGGGVHRPEVLPLVDRFYNKALFRDRSLYTRSLCGAELFTEFNQQTYGITDPQPVLPAPIQPEDTSRLHVHWSIGVGDFPRRQLAQRIGVALARSAVLNARITRTITNRREMTDPTQPRQIPEDAYRFDVNARLGHPGYPTIAYHRTWMQQVLDEATARNGWRVAQDRVPPPQFMADLYRSRITFSPFGWGELCFRDFEAIRAGSLLVKPDMSHLETWPDIYIAGETYVPVAWDGSNLEEVIGHYLAHPAERARIAANAFSQLKRELADLPARSAGILLDLISSS
jgi:hypothetical protein